MFLQEWQIYLNLERNSISSMFVFIRNNVRQTKKINSYSLGSIAYSNNTFLKEYKYILWFVILLSYAISSYPNAHLETNKYIVLLNFFFANAIFKRGRIITFM